MTEYEIGKDIKALEQRIIALEQAVTRLIEWQQYTSKEQPKQTTDR